MDSDPTSELRAAIGLALAALSPPQPKRRSLAMTPTALRTLEILRRTGPRRITELANIEGITQPSMTALVNTLDRSGMVTRRTDPSDARARLVAITTAGTDVAELRQRYLASTYADLLGQLSADEIDALAGALHAISRLSELTNAHEDALHPDRWLGSMW